MSKIITTNNIDELKGLVLPNEAGSVTTENLANGAVTTAKLADGAVTSDIVDWTTMTWGKEAKNMNDFDAVQDSGLYIWVSGSAGTFPNPAAPGIAYFVIHMHLNSNYERQLAFQINSDLMHTRNRQNGKWTAWVRF